MKTKQIRHSLKRCPYVQGTDTSKGYWQSPKPCKVDITDKACTVTYKNRTETLELKGYDEHPQARDNKISIWLWAKQNFTFYTYQNNN